MLSVERTEERFKYDPLTLTDGSKREVVVICDYCGVELAKTNKNRIIGYRDGVKKDACKKCRQKKKEDVCMFKYGVKNVAQRKEVKDKLTSFDFDIEDKKDGFQFRVTPDAISSYVNHIDEETSTTTSSYTVLVTPTININSIIEEVLIDNMFEPILTIDFEETSSGENGKTISFNEDYEHSKVFQVTQMTTLRDENLAMYRKYSLIILSAFSILVIIRATINRESLEKHIHSLTHVMNSTVEKNKDDLHKNRVLNDNQPFPDKKGNMICSLDELVKSGRYSDKKFEIFYIKEGDTIRTTAITFSITSRGTGSLLKSRQLRRVVMRASRRSASARISPAPRG